MEKALEKYWKNEVLYSIQSGAKMFIFIYKTVELNIYLLHFYLI